jgi:hypothetical protein
LEPLQFSFRRKVSKKELPARCNSRTLKRLRHIFISSPGAMGMGGCPSAVKIVSTFRFNTLTESNESMLTTTDRFDNVCGQIGVIVKTSAVGLTTAPPAASEYAVLPVGEQTISPSQR